MLVLLGVAVVVAGFVARINPLIVILIAAVTTGVLAAVGPGLTPQLLAAAAVDTISRFGTAFNENRYFHITWLVLPVIGLLERAGLQERARILIRQVKAATAGISRKASEIPTMDVLRWRSASSGSIGAAGAATAAPAGPPAFAEMRSRLFCISGSSI